MEAALRRIVAADCGLGTNSGNESMPEPMPESTASFAIENFGCRAARADGEAVTADLLARGLMEQPMDQASVVLVNTCTVTAEADRDARAFLRRIRRRNPQARIVVTGCYAQRAPEELAALDGVSAVVGNSHKSLVGAVAARLATERSADAAQAGVEDAAPALLPAARLLGSASVWADDAFAHTGVESAEAASLTHWSPQSEQTRPGLKIQEGCNNRCSFCVIPFTRGASRSMPAARVLAEVRAFVAAGGRELVLSGINLGRWGRDLDEPAARASGLAGLIARILNETAIERLRLSSVEPMDWTQELIASLAGSGAEHRRVAPHAHLPLQSGSDAVLRRMHRRYRPWHYAAKVESLAAACGDALALGADVMVGFPGESDAEFEETVRLLDALPFTYLHLFPFSPRPGTPGHALHAAHPVPAFVVRERMRTLHQLAQAKSAVFRQRMTGRSLRALTLHTPAELRARGCTLALTENFLEYELEARLDSNLPVLLRPVSAATATLVKSQGNPA